MGQVALLLNICFIIILTDAFTHTEREIHVTESFSCSVEFEDFCENCLSDYENLDILLEKLFRDADVTNPYDREPLESKPLPDWRQCLRLVYTSTQQQLVNLRKVDTSTISKKETRSRIARLKRQSEMNVASKEGHGHPERINQDDGSSSVNLRDKNSSTASDGQRIAGRGMSDAPLPRMEMEVNRLASFKTWPHSAPVSANALARAGFFYLGSEDKVQCFACQGKIRDWEYGDTAMGEHKKHFPKCPFVRDPSYLNVPIDGDVVQPKGASNQLTDRRAEEKASKLFKAPAKETKNPQGGVKKAPGRQVKNNQFEEMNEVTHKGKPTRQPAVDSAANEMRLTFRSEYKRLLSFQNWPQLSPVNPRDLAKAGFYYMEKDDVVQCFACFGKIANWEATDIPLQEHTRHFPNCPFVMGLDVKNEPITPLQAASAVSIAYREPSGFESSLKQFSKEMGIVLPQTATVQRRWEQAPSPQLLDNPKYPDFVGEQARIMSFQGFGWPGVLGITPQQLARAGFFFTGEGDCTKCFYCGGGLKHWESTDEPWTEHAKWFPVCAWLQQQRGQTFVNYVVRNFPVDTAQLAEAHAKPIHRDRSEKSKSAPAGAASQASASGGVAKGKEAPEEEAGVVFKKTASGMKESPLDRAMASRLTKRVLEMGYDEDLIRRVVQQRLLTAGKEFEGTNDLLEAVWKEEEAQDQATGESAETPKNAERTVDEISFLTKELQNIKVRDSAALVGGNIPWPGPRSTSPEDIEREIERLRDEKLCKVCMDNDADIVFIPCTHLVVCNSCASSLSTCPICRQTIRDAVKVFKS